MTVPYIKTLSEFNSMVSSEQKLIVVDFTASWCGPCKMIAPFFQQMSDTIEDAVFVKVDVDEAEDIASHCQIQAMPTFKFYKGGKEIKSFSGADKDQLQQLVKTLK